MEKDWMYLTNRISSEYKNGVDNFISFAKENAMKKGEDPESIPCPCKCCKNLRRESSRTLRDHLIVNGMDLTYHTFVLHGEEPKDGFVGRSETYNLCRSAYMPNDHTPSYEDDGNNAEFTTFVETAEAPLFLGCTKYTKLSAVAVLYKHKAVSGWSDKSFHKLLEIFHDMLPDNIKLPNSFYVVKKMLKEFGMEEVKIDACVNDCVLYHKDLKNEESCPKCHSSRWKVDPQTKKIRKNVPAKVLRYFPIIPRFKRMYASPEKAELLRWHSNNMSRDGCMRHPVDSFAWDRIKKLWPAFHNDPRNLRLALATDGINPYRDLSSTYSIWPVMLVTYNLPPWMCMKKEHIMLALLIPGPKQPGNDIDVYLEPLIDDLLLLWDTGIVIYDAFTKMPFRLRAILMWTASDYPAYGNLCGCTTKGRKACAVCADKTVAKWLKFSWKFAFLGNRRFLEEDHIFRFKAAWFDGHFEFGSKPPVLSGTRIYEQVKDIENDWGKGESQNKRKTLVGMWKKNSGFFKLPYWKDLVLRHNLDVMHIEKNVCESIVATIVNIKGKSKDGINSRKDLQKLGIRESLHPTEINNKTYIPAAPFTLSSAEKKVFLQRLKNLKLPDGYSSNIGSRCVKTVEGKVIGLKSHDCHVLMQQLLPVALKDLLPSGPRNAIIRFCGFFNKLCQKTISVEDMENLEDEFPETLCMVERFFPPSFFDIMVHLTIHLAREARLCGPVQFRWMFAFERYMKILKGYVRNRARPEGCIAENYLAEEALRFCGEHIKQVAEMDHRECRNEEYDSEVILEGRPASKQTPIWLSDAILESAHRYILFNMAEVEPYIGLHLEELKHQDPRLSRHENLLQKRHVENFSSWLKQKIDEEGNHTKISKTLKWLAHGPRNQAMSCSCYIINGQRFHTKDAEKSTQNSGVSIDAQTRCRASSKDPNQVETLVTYYGFIKDIILLDYYTFQVPLFNCYWANIKGGVKIEDGFILVNLFQGQNQQKDPFILASQAKKVFYSRENDTSNWYVLLKVPSSGYDEFDTNEEIVDTFSEPLDVSELNRSPNDENDAFVRKYQEGMWL